MEICKPDGSIVVMVMNEDGSVTEQEKPAHQQIESDCAFCFNIHNLQMLAATDLKNYERLTGQTGLLNRSQAIALQSAGYLYAPRGPPTFS